MLAELGLVGKLAISKTMTESQIIADIKNLFKDSFEKKNGIEFEFSFLTIIAGTKLVRYPKVNSTFMWDGAAVVSLNRSVIYIAVSENNLLINGLPLHSCTVQAGQDATSSANASTVSLYEIF